MNPKDILLFGLKGSIRAYRRDTGEMLWTTHLKSAGFVSFVADEARVYAYTDGELFCLDLFSGNGVWNDTLKGWGFDLAALGFPGGGQAPDAALRAKLHADAEAAQHSMAHTANTSAINQ